MDARYFCKAARDAAGLFTKADRHAVKTAAGTHLFLSAAPTFAEE